MAPAGSSVEQRELGASWEIREARPLDVEAIAEAVSRLLIELGATPPPVPQMQAATRSLLDDADTGALLLAESDGTLIGVLGASWQTAIHIPGRYGLIQDLWVEPSWRTRAVGAALLERLLQVAGDRGLTRIEVGLPKDDFAALAATEAFYRNNGFTALGSRMRRSLP